LTVVSGCVNEGLSDGVGNVVEAFEAERAGEPEKSFGIGDVGVCCLRAESPAGDLLLPFPGDLL
jgi:hypothetical protein